jgi:hypothetical protein
MANPTPAQPTTSQEREIFTLRYNKQTVQTVTFYANSLEQAIEIGKRYCDTFRLRYIHVGPFAVDLEEIIKRKENSND